MRKLSDISQMYAADAALFDSRIRRLRQMAEATADPDTRQTLLRRIAELEPIVRQSRALARYTANYYGKEDTSHAQRSL